MPKGPVNNFGSGRGRLGRAVRSWRRAVRDDVPVSLLILVELAVDAADLADLSRLDGNARTYLSAAARLQTLITAVDRGRVGGKSKDVDGDVDDAWSAELAELVRSGADVGDSSIG